MLDVLKGVATGGWSFVVSWIFPSLLACVAVAFLLLPARGSPALATVLSGTSAANQTLAVVAAAVLVGLLLSALSTPLYRVLEGYQLLPERLKTAFRGRQAAKRRTLQKRLEELEGGLGDPSASGGTGTAAEGRRIEIGLVQERLRRFPSDPAQLAPTGFGNALRAAETYGYDRFQLDSQSLWTELRCCAPDALRQDEAEARSTIDFFVSLLYLSVVFFLLGMATLVDTDAPLRVVAASAVSLAAVPVWYRLAIVGTRYWQSVVQALVNVSRVPLAEKLGLQIPPTLEQEREMWQLVTWLTTSDYDEYWGKQLDRYRVGGAPEPSG